jgi:hypothetical protein
MSTREKCYCCGIYNSNYSTFLLSDSKILFVWENSEDLVGLPPCFLYHALGYPKYGFSLFLVRRNGNYKHINNCISGDKFLKYPSQTWDYLVDTNSLSHMLISVSKMSNRVFFYVVFWFSSAGSHIKTGIEILFCRVDWAIIYCYNEAILFLRPHFGSCLDILRATHH